MTHRHADWRTGIVYEVPNEDETFCGLCGQFKTACQVVTLLHTWQDHHVIHVTRCRECAGQTLCPAQQFGLHGPVVAADEDEYDKRYEFIGPLPNSHQFGYCGSCYTQFRWDVPKQTWVDLSWGDLAKQWAADGSSSSAAP